jgi:hypothetical protein
MVRRLACQGEDKEDKSGVCVVSLSMQSRTRFELALGPKCWGNFILGE